MFFGKVLIVATILSTVGTIITALIADKVIENKKMNHLLMIFLVMLSIQMKKKMMNNCVPITRHFHCKDCKSYFKKTTDDEIGPMDLISKYPYCRSFNIKSVG